jgi:hypothetical protein
MHRLRTFRITAALILLLLGVSAPSPAHAGYVSYQVNVDTSSPPIPGTDGFLFFQFNPGDATSQLATATVTGFQGVGGTLTTSAQYDGDASGLLPGSLTLVNDTALNDVLQGFTFGSSLSFDVALSGPGVGATAGATASPFIPAGSSFALSLFDSLGDILLTTDPNSSVVTLNLNADGTTSPMTFGQSPTNNTPATSIIPAVTPAPEPSSLTLLASALPAAFAIGLRLRRRIRPSS